MIHITNAEIDLSVLIILVAIYSSICALVGYAIGRIASRD